MQNDIGSLAYYNDYNLERDPLLLLGIKLTFRERLVEQWDSHNSILGCVYVGTITQAAPVNLFKHYLNKTNAQAKPPQRYP